MNQNSTPMNNIFKSIVISIKCLVLFMAISFNAHSQTSKTFVSGSYIVNMGVHSGTRATDISKELKAWGFVYDMLKNYNVPVYVVISPTKAKDSADFTYNGVKYKGGTFLIDKKNISSAVTARITYWISQGMQGAYTNSNLTLDYSIRYIVAPKWTLDDQSSGIVTSFFTNAGIPTTSYDLTSPALLGACNDIFVMPHADPTWASHANLYNWNLTYKGAIWTGCHAGSALHNTYNPTNISQQMNFLTSKTNTAGTGITIPVANSTSYSQNSLQLWTAHADPTSPYTTCSGTVASGTLATPSDPVAQFIGITDAAHLNGSERGYIPAKNQTWLSTTKIITYDATSPNIPGVSNGPDVLIAYGRAFGDNNRGWVMMEAGHDIDKGSIGDVAAQRAFWNWSFLAVQDKAVVINSVSGLPTNGIITGSPSTYNLSVNYTATAANTNLTFTWSCVKSSDGSTFGSFSPNGTTTSNNTVFSPASVSVPTDVVISVVITDACGRKTFESYPLTVVPVTVSISGTVWNDGNTSANNTFNNIYSNGEVGANANNTLYVYCVDQNGLIIGIDTVNADGTYSFSNLPSNTSGLSLVLSTLPGQIGSLPPSATIGTSGWGNTTPLIRTGISTGTSNVASLDFGIYSYPDATNNQYATDSNVPVTSNVATNDFPSANPNNTWAVTNNPRNGSVTMNSNGSFTYTPNNNYSGNDTFYYSICDQYRCDTARVIIYITASAPVTLSSFTARIFDTKQSVINFTTDMEMNAHHFDIERSTDAIHFIKRGTVSAVGNSNIKTNYQYFDGTTNSSNVLYYRLRLVDNDGSFKYSNIISLRLKGINAGDQMIVYPNPFSNNLKIEVISQIKESATITMYTIDGKIVTQQFNEIMIGNNIIPINNLSSIQKGNYLIEVKTASGKVIKKIVKN